jgi:hypothetical protein
VRLSFVPNEKFRIRYRNCVGRIVKILKVLAQNGLKINAIRKTSINSRAAFSN